MSTITKENLVLKGGEYLVKESEAHTVFTPEQFDEEQLMFADMIKEFIKTRVHTNLDRIDKQEEGLMIELLNESADLGLLGAGIPEEYGGLGVNIHTETILNENLGPSHSFGVAVAAHTGIGTLPIQYFGTDKQKEFYLPKLASGELKAAYCLTEPGSGSDALAAKTKAVLTEDGEHYIIEGQKMWITNGGFADVFIVFAKIDGEKFTGFIVDAKSDNISLGAEEDKLGIKGSSTRQVFFQGVRVPKENVLGKIGQGHKIAFNVLNIGRYKLCAMAVGGSKQAIKVATKYANERNQFGTPISSFGAIQHKLAEMAVQTFAAESATYRTSGLIKGKIDSLKAKGLDAIQAKLEAAEEYAIECALLKVLGSEALAYCVDETVQVFGGYGFSEEYPAARAYRDARINRIFEGTNEINRLLSVGMTLKKAMKGEIDLMTPTMALQQELATPPSKDEVIDNEGFAADKKAIINAKKAILLVAGSAIQKFGPKLDKEQEIVMALSDMCIQTFAAESALLRVERMAGIKGEEASALYIDLMKTNLSDAIEKIQLHGKHALSGFLEDDVLKMTLSGLRRLTRVAPYNTIAARKRIASALIEANDFCF